VTARTRIPRAVLLGIIMVVVAGLIPLALIVRARVARSEKPRVHLIWHMDNQPRFKAQQRSNVFPDGRASRPPVPGTIARGELQEDPHYWRGMLSDDLPPEGDNLVTTFPPQVQPLTEAFLLRGQERFDIYCAVCHGRTGSGQGTTHRRAVEKEQATWVPPRVLYDDQTRVKPVGAYFQTITHGFQTMPSYGSQVDVRDRWAIIAHIRVLQRAHLARLADLTAEERQRLLAVPYTPPEEPPPEDQPPDEGEPGEEER
jgi:mono/diheme cytochrome c family protein